MSICLLFIFGCFEHLDVFSRLGTKTPYKVPQEKLEKLEELKDCRVIHINHLGRHGSRHMNNTKNIKSLSDILAAAQAMNELKRPGIFLIKLLESARNLERPENLKLLTTQGKQEQRGIAERMYEEFPDLFKASSIHKKLVLQSTHVKRTKESLEEFLRRLIELQPQLAHTSQIISTEPEICDPKLRFFDACNNYISHKKESSWRPIAYKSIWTTDAQTNIKTIINRLFYSGFINTLDMQKQIDIIRNIYSLCQLDANINKNNLHNNFCSFFEKESELAYFNWEEDVLNYFNKGFAGHFGHVAHKSACPLVADFLASSARAITDPQNAPVAHLRFGHAETIMPFLVLVGLYNQDSATNMLTRAQERSFRVADVSPMAANVQWLLYACPQEEYRVRMLHNEENISFPIAGCEKNAWCDWHKVKSFLEQEGRSCDLESWERDVCEGISCIPSPDYADD